MREKDSFLLSFTLAVQSMVVRVPTLGIVVMVLGRCLTNSGTWTFRAMIVKYVSPLGLGPTCAYTC